jgi:hypothetical protein
MRELESTVSEIAVALFARGTVEQTLHRIVLLAERAVDGCEAAGVMVTREGVVTTVAATSDLVLLIDQMQIDAGEGPCVDALQQSTAFAANDLLDDRRWPRFARAAASAGVRSVLAYSLSRTHPSVLNLYARLPAAFGATDRAQGELFATLARLALDSAEHREVEDSNAANFAAALLTREVIGQAQGILMERERITSDQAFHVLRRASQHMNIKLREVAETLVETGETPETGRPAP